MTTNEEYSIDVAIPGGEAKEQADDDIDLTSESPSEADNTDKEKSDDDFIDAEVSPQ